MLFKRHKETTGDTQRSEAIEGEFVSPEEQRLPTVIEVLSDPNATVQYKGIETDAQNGKSRAKFAFAYPGMHYQDVQISQKQVLDVRTALASEYINELRRGSQDGKKDFANQFIRDKMIDMQQLPTSEQPLEGMGAAEAKLRLRLLDLEKARTAIDEQNLHRGRVSSQRAQNKPIPLGMTRN